jgi:hypothetical protein
VAHSLIVIGYYLQRNQSNYEDLGGNYFDRIHSDGLKRHYLVKRLEQLGHKVTRLTKVNSGVSAVLLAKEGRVYTKGFTFAAPS